jgi:hypothetical protein
MRKKHVIVLGLVLILCSDFVYGSAAEHKLTLPTLTEKADLVGIGRVVDLENRVINGQSWTFASVTMEKGLKGRSGGQVRVKIPGGQQTIQGRILVTKVEGAPELNVNQRAVFFLNGKEQEDYVFTGLGSGFWRVETKEGMEVAAPATTPEAAHIPLNRLVSEVERAVRKKK